MKVGKKKTRMTNPVSWVYTPCLSMFHSKNQEKNGFNMFHQNFPLHQHSKCSVAAPTAWLKMLSGHSSNRHPSGPAMTLDTQAEPVPVDE